jgi:UDP-glucose 4-epimerase
MAEWFEAEVTTDALLSINRPVDAVVHCAGSGSVGFSLAHPHDDFRMTVDTTAAVLEYLRLAAPDARLVYPSSAAVYGCLYHGPIHESSSLAPVSPYGTHKRMAEDLCLSYHRSFQVAVSVIRFFSLYGPGLRKQLLWDACNRLAQGGALEFFGTGNEVRDWLHVRDAAALVRMVAEAPAAGLIVNGGSGKKVTVRDVLARTAAFLETGAQLSFNGCEREGDPAHLEADIASARRLGWSPAVELEAGIQEYVTWFREGAA